MQLTLQKKRQRADLLTLSAVAALFLVLAALLYAGLLNRQMTNMLVPTAVYIVMAVSLNLVVGLLGELSLGHAGFMSVGLFSGCLVSIALSSSPLPLGLRLPLSMQMCIRDRHSRPFTGTSSPSWATIFSRTPSCSLVTSLVSLSVVISSSTSPVFTASPSCLIH